MEKMKEQMIYLMKNDGDVSNARLCHTHFYASLVMALTSLVMTIQNVRNDSWAMAGATTALCAGFLLNLFISGVLKNYTVSVAVLVLLAGSVLSAFIITGGNQGFACLWVLIVPLVAVFLLGVIPGTILSLYFMIFILVMFYTPLNAMIADKYTTAHMQRFPILYACDMALSLLTSLKREFFYRKLKENSFYDELTGIYNRNFCMNQIEKAEIINGNNLTVIRIDVNGLKKVNDTLGHEGGDELLTGLANLCRKVFGDKAGLFRMGGDEFSIMIDKPAEAVEEDIRKLCQERDKWRGRLNKKLEFAIGYAAREEFPDFGPEELMKKAEARMYRDKADFYIMHERGSK